ncbi:MAG TPA: Rrf2 family transcriptional regulator [Dehalococcoidia bacterium]|nr:Rrf2 family transcriptional regulator [Dehalococcoidia bacterium]
MRVSARIDYAVRALVELDGSTRAEPRKLHDLAAAQQIPVSFLADILAMLRHAGLVSSQRGADGGYWLAKPPVDIRLAAVIAAVDGPFMEVAEAAPGGPLPAGAVALGRVWDAMRELARLVTIAEVASGELPWPVLALARADERAGATHNPL